MREARLRFDMAMNPAKYLRGGSFPDEAKIASAHVALAVAHYSLIKRYMGGLRKLIGAWHLWRTLVHDHKALKLGLDTPEQVETVARHLSKSPFPWHVWAAYEMLEEALEQDEMQHHTRALMLITIGELEEKFGFPKLEVAKRFIHVVHLRDAVLEESDQLMAKRQWVRIASACGFWFWDHQRELQTEKDPEGAPEIMSVMFAEWMLPEALEMAMEVSQDQVLKIQEECRKRGLGFTNPKSVQTSILSRRVDVLYRRSQK